MYNANARENIDRIIRRRRIEASDVTAMRRWFYAQPVLCDADAVDLFRLVRASGITSSALDDFFVETLSDYILYQQRPTARIDAGKVAWLLDLFGGAQAILSTAAELRLLLNLLDEAHEAPEELAAFALRQIRHTAMTGEGPAAQGRAHYSRTIDRADVDLIERVLSRRFIAGQAAVSRLEVEELCALDSTCKGTGDSNWDALYLSALAGFLAGADDADGQVTPHRAADPMHEQVEKAMLAVLTGRAASGAARSPAAVIRMA